MTRVNNLHDVEMSSKHNGNNGFVSHGVSHGLERDDETINNKGMGHVYSETVKDKSPGHQWPVDSDGLGMPKGETELQEEEEEDPGGFADALIAICENTSFQGVPFVVAPTPFSIRRYNVVYTQITQPIHIVY